MEHPHNLLQLVVKQHYKNKPEVLETANNMLMEYSEGTTTYQQTLNNLFQLLNDLPSEIKLYYLSTVPLPKNQEVKSNSVLPGLMKQMLIPLYHNCMRPILLKYLNEEVPPLGLLSSKPETEISATNLTHSDDDVENKENIRSVIDDNINQEKNKNRKINKAKTKNIAKNSNVKPLSILCANNIYKNHHSYCSQYKKLKREAWRLVHSNKCNKEELDHCYNVIKDVNRKIKWLGMIKTGKVSKAIVEEEYGNSDVFYLERNLQNTVADDILDVDQNIFNSINVFLSKC